MAGVKEKVETFKEKLNSFLEQKNAVTDLLAQVESKTGVKRLYIVSGFIGLIALWLMIGYGAQFLCNFVGFLYPAYASVKAIETSKKEDDTQWLTYWVVYSAFALIEFFADIFLFWVPFYWFLKCCFLVWCMMPMTNGANTIYQKLLKPFVLKHQQRVDEAIDNAANVINEASDIAKDVAVDAAAEAMKKTS